MTDHPLPDSETMLAAYRKLIETSEQAIPVLVYWGEKGGVPIGLAGVDSEHPMSQVIRGALNVAKKSLGPAEWVCFSTEAYYKVVSVEELGQFQKGDNIKGRAEGDPTVMECAMVHAFHRDGSSWHVTLPFERVGGEVFWGTPFEMPSAQTDGDVPQALLTAFA